MNHKAKLLFIIIFFCTVSLSAKPDRSRQNIDSLRSSIDKIFHTAGTNVNIGMEVISLKTGEVLYEHNAKNLFVPASIIKLLTCAAAIDRLGSEYQFETKVLKDDAGNLYIIGSGDPSLTEHDLEELALQIALKKEKSFEGDLIVDVSIFDSIVNGPGWMWDEGDHYWNSPIDALLVDHSCVDLWIMPTTLKSSPEFYFRTGGDYVNIENRALTLEDTGELEVIKSPLMRENKIEIRGVLNPNTPPQLFRLPVVSPHLYTAHLFRQKLEKHGISIKGPTHIGKVPQEAAHLFSHFSQPLALIIRKSLKDSDNLTSNCLFKKLGQDYEGAQGTWQNGSHAVRDFLTRKVGIQIKDLVMLDGSGESRYNLVSPHQMTQFLVWASKQFNLSPELLAGLPRNGCDGSNKSRLMEEAIRGKVRAKPGSMTGISSLSGFIEAQDGEVLAMTIIANGFTKKAMEIKTEVEDPICHLLTQFKRN
jgi:serine-type D-Ala-D-Ala carboxypeptidase/endopeptidase (penicillin-binding protein 4)